MFEDQAAIQAIEEAVPLPAELVLVEDEPRIVAHGWRPPSKRPFTDADAATWHATAVLLHGRLGRPVRPRDFQDHARTAEGENIRHLFTWDNEVAADLFRDLEAAYWTRATCMIVGADSAPLRILANVIVDRERGYVPLTEVLKDNEYKKQVLAEAACELKMFKHKLNKWKLWLGEPHVARLQKAAETIEEVAADLVK